MGSQRVRQTDPHTCTYSLCSVMSDSVAVWTVAHQVSLFMEFSRQGSWSGLPFPTPGDLPDPGIEPATLTSPVLAGRLSIISTSWEGYREYSASPWPPVPQGGQGTPSLLEGQAPAHFYAKAFWSHSTPDSFR